MSYSMKITEIFESFAADFEACVADDDWTRLEKYLADDATYQNVGRPEPKYTGRKAVIDFLKSDVANTDRKFDTRTLVALSPPAVAPTSEGDRLSRQWRITYTIAGVPDLVVEGEAQYRFEAGQIKQIEEEVTADSMQRLVEWMEQYGERLASQ